MRRNLLLLSLALAAACVTPPPKPPQPAPLHSSRAATEVAKIAAYGLHSAGFRVTQTDEWGEALEGVRTATANANEQYIICHLPKNAGAVAYRETAFVVTLEAKPTQSGSDVTIRSVVHTSYPAYAGTAMAIAPNDTDCVSNGTMERRLADAVR
jgi:hypothetical protein